MTSPDRTRPDAPEPDEARFDEPGFDDDLPALYHVVYCSRAVAGIGDEAVDLIVATAQRHNARHGITGLLTFGGDTFFQWIEGPRAEVRRLMDNIRADPRHHSVVELGETEEARERLFPDWAMERVTPEDIRTVLLDAQQAATDARSADALARLLAQLDAGPPS